MRGPSPYSLFVVETDDELRWVTMGINSGRGSLKEDVYFIPIRPGEFESVGVSVGKTLGDTRCHIANDLHREFVAEEEQLRQLCHKVMEARRAVLSLRSSELVHWESQTREEGCLAVKDSPGCKVVRCRAPDAGGRRLA